MLPLSGSRLPAEDWAPTLLASDALDFLFIYLNVGHSSVSGSALRSELVVLITE